MTRVSLLTIILIPLLYGQIFGQQDTIWTTDKNLIVGEVKSMDRGVVTIETKYSDKDFAVEWVGIAKIKTVTEFFITTKDGSRLLGNLSSDSTGHAKLTNIEGEIFLVEIEDIVYMNGVDEGFWSRIYASIEFGYSFTKANNLQQITSRSSIGYIAETWSANMTFNTLQSSQDSATPTQRSDGEAAFKYFLPKDWYLTIGYDFLSNSEQKLDLRSNMKLGLGKFIIHTNRAYWTLVGGAAYNVEKFTSEDPDRYSWEGFFGTELNLYKIGDLNLLTNFVAYPSFTESGRWRYDAKFDLKYDFPLDFYLKVGTTVNYDNRPVEGASEFDYVFQTTLGWEW